MADDDHTTSGRVVFDAHDLANIQIIANRHRDALVESLAHAYPGREAEAVGAALAVLFANSMTSDPAQQSDQARILNKILFRCTAHKLPWRLEPVILEPVIKNEIAAKRRSRRG
jgi:hypothetical protein